MARFRPLRGLLLAILAACADGPTAAPAPAPPDTAPQVEGAYRFTLSGLGGEQMRASAAPAVLGGGASLALAPVSSGITFESVSSGSFTDGVRGQGGQRYVYFTYRVRNTTGRALSNLTILPAMTGSTVPGTPFTALTRFDGTAASPSLGPQIVPTGAVTLGAGTALRAPDPDVLQVFQESEVAAIPLPAGITGVLAYGFVVRNPATPSSRTLPPASGPGDYGGVVTFAFRLPLTGAASQDPYAITFYALAVQDTETRLTESMEEGQDTAAVRRLRDRAAALGATTVTVLPGSGAAGVEVHNYPGQRQVCSVRTAGTAGAPVTYITHPAGYARLLLLRPGEKPSPCGAGFRAGTPAAATPGEPYTLTLRAVDRYGNLRAVADSVRLERVSGPAATFGAPVALAGGVATVQATYGGKGNSVLQAAGERIRGQQQVDVGAPSVSIGGGNRQTAMAGTAVPVRPWVRVLDGAGNPLPGRAVKFTVTGGGGAVTSAVVTADADGVAAVGRWTLGAEADLNTLAARVAGTGVSGNPVQFNASGCEGGGGPGFQVTLCYASSILPARRAAFRAAANRWEELVTGDLADAAVHQPVGFCPSSPGLDMAVDDVVVFAVVQAMDGAGRKLASAGPCWVRAAGSLPLVGTVRVDAADLSALEADGRLANVLVHEMGHVLGIGTLWTELGLLRNPSSAGASLDTYFSGAAGVAGFDAIGGASYTGGHRVPVENTGSGAMNVHWRESVLANELMTGYLNAGANPLSQLSVRSLADLGYTVNPAAADPFFLTLTLLRPGENDPGALSLIGDVEAGPLFGQDAQGRVTRIR